MSPDLAFGCAHRRCEVMSEFDSVAWRQYIVCLECTTKLVEVVRDERVRA